jgi:hypothetical protein
VPLAPLPPNAAPLRPILTQSNTSYSAINVFAWKHYRVGFNMDVYDVEILPDLRSRLGSRIFPGFDFGNMDVRCLISTSPHIL